jgi:cyclase
MIQTRVIPCLLLKGRGLVKTIKFGKQTYLGDPINIIKIFNDKEVDEVVLLDITATIERRKPNIKYILEIASECFIPLGYGGGISSLSDIREILNVGIEKVIINSYANVNPSFIREAASEVGSQSIVVSIDVKRNHGGKLEVYSHGGKKGTGRDPVQFAQEMVSMGAGEILLNAIDRDGTMQGYDIELIKRVAEAVPIPVVACGGAASLNDFVTAVKLGHASGVAAGSLFVFQGRNRAVLINYPNQEELHRLFAEKDS